MATTTTAGVRQNVAKTADTARRGLALNLTDRDHPGEIIVPPGSVRRAAVRTIEASIGDVFGRTHNTSVVDSAWRRKFSTGALVVGVLALLAVSVFVYRRSTFETGQECRSLGNHDSPDMLVEMSSSEPPPTRNLVVGQTIAVTAQLPGGRRTSVPSTSQNVLCTLRTTHGANGSTTTVFLARHAGAAYVQSSLIGAALNLAHPALQAKIIVSP